MKKGSQPLERWPFLAWLILPIIVFWLSVSYLVGSKQPPAWVTEKLPQKNEPQPRQARQWGGNGLITFWFDDAWTSQFTVAFPILAKEQMKAALSVATSLVGYDQYLNWAQINRLQESGWEIASHTRSHGCQPEKMTLELIEKELKGSREDLEKRGLLADNFVTPCGSETPLLEDIVQKYYRSLRTSASGLNSLPVKKPYSLKIRVLHPNTSLEEIAGWLQEAQEKKGWLILALHQIDQSNQEYSFPPKKFKETVSIVKDSALSVVLPNQALNLTSLDASR
jgi:peptidoglycan/xylan/chitin deacetylase (PgdA/CDA1 family)